ncbi:hypothetical protein ACHQM5_001161 [Ranunculus cassubicifolius]
MSEQSNSRKTKLSRNSSRGTRRPPNPIFTRRQKSFLSSRGLKRSKPVKFDLQRSRSEPILWTVGVFLDENENKRGDEVDNSLFFSRHSCADIFTSTSMSPFASNPERYNKDTKVVVNVTVEGSPGPVRTLVKLGTTVEDTIKLVVDKYCEEGRSPHLPRDTVSSFELHQSHFSLESISKKDAIGDVGTRSFYLRQNSSRRDSNGGGMLTTPMVTTFILMPSFLARKASKIGRRMHRLWRVLICSP